MQLNSSPLAHHALGYSDASRTPTLLLALQTNSWPILGFLTVFAALLPSQKLCLGRLLFTPFSML
jgi:hypothetical protein